MSCEIIRRSETSCLYSLGEVSTDNYLWHTRPSAQCDYRSALQGCSLTDVPGKSEAGMTEPSPGSLRRHGLASLAYLHKAVLAKRSCPHAPNRCSVPLAFCGTLECRQSIKTTLDQINATRCAPAVGAQVTPATSL